MKMFPEFKIHYLRKCYIEIISQIYIMAIQGQMGFFFHSVRTIDEDGIFSCMAHGEGRVTAIYQIYFH